jgi:hypothetical protein
MISTEKTIPTDYRLDTGYAVGLVLVLGGRVVGGAPIFWWMLGLEWVEVLRRLRLRGQVKDVCVIESST